MRKEMSSVERLVERAVQAGEFASREDCAEALLNWLVLNDYVNPSRLCDRSGNPESGLSIEDRSPQGVSAAEDTLLQYEILRDRDA